MELALPLTMLLTLISPFISAYVQSVDWSPKTKTLLAIVLSLIIAILYLWMTNGIADWSQLTVVVPAVYGLQQAVYNFFLKNIATKFEAITQFGSLVVSPSQEAGKVDITSDTTIKETGDKVAVETPVQIVTPPDSITTDTPAKG